MFEFVNKYIIGAILPPLLILSGVFFSVRLKFLHLLHPLKILKIMLRKPKEGGISPFAAVSMALAGTLGVGNIVGVASAISLGGFGAIFWMWISASAACILKYAEITLAVAHRREDKDGRRFGGAMYYIRDLFFAKEKYTVGKVLSLTFALLCIADCVTMGCVVQVNAAAGAFSGAFGISPLAVGVIIFAAVLVVGFSKARFVYKTAEMLVPVMSVGYILLSIAVMIKNPGEILPAFGKIFSGAFTVESAAGGVVGFLLSRALRFGCMRGLMTNEAGCGTATIAHAASNAQEPSEQGVWGIFEVFFDTIVLCTMTAIVVIIAYDRVAPYSDGGIMLTLNSYNDALGDFAGMFLTVAVFLFALATVLCFSHYGRECVAFISKKSAFKTAFTIVYAVSALIGSIAAPYAVWTAADFSVGLMTLLNLYTLLAMNGEVRDLSENLMSRVGFSVRRRI